MTLTVMVLILFTGTPSAFVRVSQLLFPMGLWFNIPGYDAPPQLVKPLERNTR
jgi:hypothetical protein